MSAPDHLDEVLVPERCALIIVDMQNDYCHPDGILGSMGLDLSMVDPMCDVVAGLRETAHAQRVPVIFLKTVHTDETDSPTWKRRYAGLGGLCRADTWGADYYRLQPHGEDIVVIKHRYSGFIGTRLEHVLRALSRCTLVFTGGATNVCVESTLRDGFMRDFETLLVQDGTAAPSRAAHEATLANVDRHFGTVCSAEEVQARWTACASRPVMT
jgi:ureidoacrylate peracid hydrolase